MAITIRTFSFPTHARPLWNNNTVGGGVMVTEGAAQEANNNGNNVIWQNEGHSAKDGNMAAGTAHIKHTAACLKRIRTI